MKPSIRRRILVLIPWFATVDGWTQGIPPQLTRRILRRPSIRWHFPVQAGENTVRPERRRVSAEVEG
jgi:hypothetical protein